jgi:simple sugar transport system permease protein
MYAIPLWLAAMGELVQQRSGTWGLGIEGSMLIGAFASYFITIKTELRVVGLSSGLLVGIIAGLITAYFVVFLGQSQVLVGIGLNTVMAGLTSFLFVEQITNVYNKVPYIKVLPIVKIPLLSRIPVLGPAFFERSVVSYGVYLLFPILAIVLHKTSIGLKNRAVGESAEKCNALGINVFKTRTLSTLFAHTLAGLSGAILVLESTAAFTHGMTVGRGFLAVAIVIVSNWSLLGVAIIGFLFGVTQSGQQILQILTPQIPWQLLLALPYIFGIVALIIGALKARQPTELGIPFLRQR